VIRKTRPVTGHYQGAPEETTRKGGKSGSGEGQEGETRKVRQPQ